ncbi:MAG: prepilin-type N-terminal cleavage/methylation domain-containing protein [Planctomycetota bacterium]|jgi:prepilin-type N-terminal cleavage/methylation domain-containing protein|nr:prepilin-type N-terminal cleavage/methylation domain-containing protein [Planctomycetota bacterium]MDP6941107.1 prepilin-type N-terminal cleavage/methylation domain-containing protein [Planctomycetota bacterium]
MKQRGFTIVEVLLAMALFVVGVTALLGLFHFGGGLEQEARTHAELAPLIPAIVAEAKERAWELDDSGNLLGPKNLSGMMVTGAPSYKYDLEVVSGNDPALGRATLVLYRKNPDRPATTLRFLLPRMVSMEKRLELVGK